MRPPRLALKLLSPDQRRRSERSEDASNERAQALEDWLVRQDPPLANEVALDADMMRPGLQ